MRRTWTVVLAVLLMASVGRAEDKAAPAAPAASGAGSSLTPKQKVSYALGRNVGESLKHQGADIDSDYIARGVTDALADKEPLLSAEEIKNVMLEFQKSMIEKRQTTQKAEGDKNGAAGKKYLDENKAKEGVKTTASGLQYKVLKAGDGKSPKPTDTVKAHYKGTLIDGTEFDSSYKRNEPSKFPLNGVIKGWTEALQLMKVGDKWQLVIPADLAYGPSGRPGIPPNSTLIFEVELLGIE